MAGSIHFKGVGVQNFREKAVKLERNRIGHTRLLEREWENERHNICEGAPVFQELLGERTLAPKRRIAEEEDGLAAGSRRLPLQEILFLDLGCPRFNVKPKGGGAWWNGI
jgi:hypothetical protein